MPDAPVPILDALAAQQAELRALLDGLDAADWERPSRCAGWTICDVLLHLAQTNEMAIGSVQGRFAEALDELVAGLGPADSVEDGAAVMVRHQCGEPGPAVQQRWQQGVDELARAFAAMDLHRRVTWVAGELSARTLATTRLTECWIHTGDIAAGLGLELEPTDRLHEIARLAWRTLPHAFASAGRELPGPVAFELTGPHGDLWRFTPEDEPVTVIRGDALTLCLVAARRIPGAATDLVASGPSGDEVLELVRTFA